MEYKLINKNAPEKEVHTFLSTKRYKYAKESKQITWISAFQTVYSEGNSCSPQNHIHGLFGNGKLPKLF